MSKGDRRKKDSRRHHHRRAERGIRHRPHCKRHADRSDYDEAKSSCYDSRSVSYCGSSVASSVGQSSPPATVEATLSYLIIKEGLKDSIPAAVVLLAFYKIPSKDGLTVNRVKKFVYSRSHHYDMLKKSGLTVGKVLGFAAEFGLLERRGTRFFMIKDRSGALL